MLQFTCKYFPLIFMIDRFGSHVSGGDTVSRYLRLINTSPYGEPFTASSLQTFLTFLFDLLTFISKLHKSRSFLKLLRYPFGLGDLQPGGR